MISKSSCQARLQTTPVRILPANPATEVVPLQAEKNRLARSEIPVEIDLLHDITVVNTIKLVINLEEFVHLVENRKVAHKIVRRKPLGHENLLGLCHISPPIVVVHLVSAVRLSLHLEDLHIVDVEVVDGINVITGVDKSLFLMEYFVHLLELVCVVNMSKVLTFDSLRGQGMKKISSPVLHTL